MTESRPKTAAGQALAGWNSRSKVMADTVIRIEEEAVAAWLSSDDAARRLSDALANNVRGEAVTYEVGAILTEMAKG